MYKPPIITIHLSCPSVSKQNHSFQSRNGADVQQQREFNWISRWLSMQLPDIIVNYSNGFLDPENVGIYTKIVNLCTIHVKFSSFLLYYRINLSVDFVSNNNNTVQMINENC